MVVVDSVVEVLVVAVTVVVVAVKVVVVTGAVYHRHFAQPALQLALHSYSVVWCGVLCIVDCIR